MEKKIEKLQDEGSKSAVDNLELTQMLARLQDDKTRLTQRIDKLSGNGEFYGNRDCNA